MVLKYSNTDFKRIFQLSRPNFDKIKGFLKKCHELDVNGQGGREPISLKNSYMSRCGSLVYRTTYTVIGKGDRFGIAESFVVVCRKQIIDTTKKKMESKFINCPMLKYFDQPLKSFINETDSRELLGA